MRDAQQPADRRAAEGIEPPDDLERRGKGLRGEIRGSLRIANAPAEEAQDQPLVTDVEHGERVLLGQGRREERFVGATVIDHRAVLSADGRVVTWRDLSPCQRVRVPRRRRRA